MYLPTAALKRHDRHTSIILIVATILSYIPQYRRLHRKRDGTGLSIWYLLLNAIAATEQLALLSNLFVTWQIDNIDVPGSLIRTPPSLTDWLNLLQFGAAWICSTGLFFMFIWYKPAAPLGKAGALLGFLAWISCSLAVVAFEATPIFTNAEPAKQNWLAKNFMTYHFFIFNPISVVGVVASLFTQASTTLWLRRRRSFSVVTITLQAVVFTILAHSWKDRMHLRPDDAPDDFEPSAMAWYTGGGWAVIHSAVFAAVQLGLLGVSLVAMFMWPRRTDKDKKKGKGKEHRSFLGGRRRRMRTGERAPLLSRLSPVRRSRDMNSRRAGTKSPERRSIFSSLSPTREGRHESRRREHTKSPDRTSILSRLSPSRDTGK